MNAALAIEPRRETRTLVDVLLEEQRTLTAVERFSRLHEQGHINLRERQYQTLLPASAPALGEQYAFEVDLDRCSGCKGCVTACHSLNGLDETETWRSVGLLIGWRNTEARSPRVAGVPSIELRDPNFGVQQHVTTTCHHCADPGCLNGCPVLAYDKDPVTGIVRHLDDQCIGCSYCVMKCPYDVPKYSKRLGIVRKCDMCSSRLAVGEAPACVQACPNEAIKITVVGREEKSDNRLPSPEGNPQCRSPKSGENNSDVNPWISFGLRTSDLGTLPFFPDPSITRPTTRFVTQRPELGSVRAADASELRPAPAHPPLSVMLVLTQLGVGVLGAVVVVDPRSSFLAWLALGATMIGVVAATLHLGQPLKAWRGFLGWRRSWLSRELLAFGGVMGAMSAHALLLRPETAWIALLTGVVAVFCSAMIYVDTRRVFWSAKFTFPKFALTTVLLGAASALVLGAATRNPGLISGSAMGLLFGVLVKLGMEVGFLLRFAAVGQASSLSSLIEHSCNETTRPVAAVAKADARMKTGWKPVLHKTALLHTRVFRSWFIARILLGVTGGVLLPTFLMLGFVPSALPIALVALLFCIAGEVVERHLFFVCEAAPRMPGGVAR